MERGITDDLLGQGFAAAKESFAEEHQVNNKDS